MRNRILLFFTLAGSLLFAHCTNKSDEVAPRLDYDQESSKIMREVSPLVVGDWTLRRVHIKAQSHNAGQGELRIVRDTVFQDFATLSIRPGAPRGSFVDPRYANFEGTLRFRTKTYPVQFELLANPERVVQKKGPQANFLLQYNFPPGSHPTEPEESFLRYLGFINENFSLEVGPDQPVMTWRGLNRGIEKIELVRL